MPLPLQRSFKVHFRLVVLGWRGQSKGMTQVACLITKGLEMRAMSWKTPRLPHFFCNFFFCFTDYNLE